MNNGAADRADSGRAMAPSKATVKNIKKNLFRTFAYNNVALIPVAAGVFYPFLDCEAISVPRVSGPSLGDHGSPNPVLADAFRLRRVDEFR